MRDIIRHGNVKARDYKVSTLKMDNKATNPNDFKVVEFFNSTDFDFTPELGAMYDSRPLFVGSGERKQFPYHVGHQLAVNLAKAVLVKGAPLHDSTSNNPVGTPLWGDEKVTALKNSFLTELYADERPIVQTETDRLMARVAELEKAFQVKQAERPLELPKEAVKSIQELVAPELNAAVTPKVYQDKGEVIAELTRRGIKFDARQSREKLETLLA